MTTLNSGAASDIESSFTIGPYSFVCKLAATQRRIAHSTPKTQLGWCDFGHEKKISPRKVSATNRDVAKSHQVLIDCGHGFRYFPSAKGRRLENQVSCETAY